MDKTCSICLDIIADDSSLYKLMPCEHEFHVDCIVNWFRKKEDSCPYCRDKPNQKEEVINLLNYVNIFQYLAPVYKNFGYASSKARRKDAPTNLKKMYSNYKRYKLNYDDNSRALKEFKLKTGTYHELRNRAIKLRRAKRCWGRKIRRIKRQMCELFPDE